MAWHHFLRHILANPGNSTIYERNKWLIELQREKYSKDSLESLFNRLSSQLDTISLVATFMSGFSFLIISGSLEFEETTIPTTAIVILLAVSFIVGVSSTLLAITVKTNLMELGPRHIEKFIRKFYWMFPFLASLVIALVGTFIGAGLLIILNRFQMWIGLVIAGLTAAMFVYLAICNLQTKDFVLQTLGYGFKGNSYTMPPDAVGLGDSDAPSSSGVELISSSSRQPEELV